MASGLMCFSRTPTNLRTRSSSRAQCAVSSVYQLGNLARPQPCALQSAPSLAHCALPRPARPALCSSRGISKEVARQLLVYSFGREVVQGLREEALQARVEAAMRSTLASFASIA